MGKKRGHGEGSYRQLASGRWSWQAMEGRNPDGTVHYVRLSADTYRALTQMVADYKSQRKAAQNQPVMPSFADFASTWYERYKANIRVSTQSSYSHTLAKLADYWSDTPINQITASSVYDMLSHYHQQHHLSTSYIKKMRSMAYQIFDAAEADNLVTKNPVRYVTYRLDQQDSWDDDNTKKDAYNATEIAAMWNTPRSKIRDCTVLSVATGVRTQELLALRGDDIAADGSWVAIERAVNMAGGTPVIGATKSRDSRRRIPVPTNVRNIAAHYYTYGSKYIWESPEVPGRPINPSSYRSAFRRFCMAANIRSLTPHCTRHTYVTQLRAHGVDAEIVKALVGHSRKDVTEGYNHISRDTLSQAVNTLNDLFPSDSPDSDSSSNLSD